jgi:RNA polymerase sigma-70 factor (ECF subfamily)
VRVREARFEVLVGVVGAPVHRYLVRRAGADAVDDVRAEGRRLRLVERLARTAEVLPTATTDHAELYEALRTLGELDREVVLLWAWEGLAPRGIAEVTGLTANAVSIRLHRAKKRLAVILGRKNAVAAGQEKGKGGSEL